MNTEQVSSHTLWIATLAAIGIGVLVLVLVVLPAEYNLDPTGFGQTTGLTALSPESLEQAQEVEAEAATSSLANPTGESIQVVVLPKSGLEYKMSMQSGDQVDYEWLTDGASVYVDMHGEPKGDTTGYFKSYTIATVAQMKGSFVAPFEGSHGWYFKNETDTPITIQLHFSGQYQHPRLL